MHVQSFFCFLAFEQAQCLQTKKVLLKQDFLSGWQDYLAVILSGGRRQTQACSAKRYRDFLLVNLPERAQHVNQQKSPTLLCQACICRGGRIRTYDLLVPNEARYRATLHPVPSKRSANIGGFFLFTIAPFKNF